MKFGIPYIIAPERGLLYGGGQNTVEFMQQLRNNEIMSSRPIRFSIDSFIDDNGARDAELFGLRYRGSGKDLDVLFQQYEFGVCTASVGPTARKTILKNFLMLVLQLLRFILNLYEELPSMMDQ